MMFSAPGSTGIFVIGIIGGFYFARFIDANAGLSAGGFISVLAAIGIGPTALVLVQGYFKLNLLDPYGVGLGVGVFLNVIIRYYSLKESAKEIDKGPEAVAEPPHEFTPTQPTDQKTRPHEEMLGQVRARRLSDALRAISSSREDSPTTDIRMPNSIVDYKGFEIELASDRAGSGGIPNRPIGWRPKAIVWAVKEDTRTAYPVSPKSTGVFGTKDEADEIALDVARRWIDAGNPKG